MHLSRIPPGMRYYVGAQARLRRRVEDTAMSVFERCRYEEITTPSVDYYVLFEQGMGTTEAQRSFRFTDHDGRLLALRPDVTSSVARAAATLLAERPRPLRLCYAGPVFKQQSQSPAEWRRETTQLGCELIGSEGADADLEVLLVAAEILNRLGLSGNYCITINNVEVFNGILEQLSVEADVQEDIRRLVDSRALPELSLYSSGENKYRVLSQLVPLSGKRDVLDQAECLISNPRSKTALAQLRQLWRGLEANGLAQSFEIDLADVGGLDYYTGLSFKIFVNGAGSRIGRGGRYDGLISNFGRTEPAVGFVLNLDGLTEVLSEQPAE
ncbi:MAG TPA: ATP phosphoribosyltransferase regulatory subunit [Pyrinomonadaceae bacterium]